jgi:hypothetical protein
MKILPNVSADFQADNVNCLLCLLNGTLSNRPRQWAKFWDDPQAMTPAGAPAYQAAARELQSCLDQWIDSGRRCDGSEAPRERRLNDDAIQLIDCFYQVSSPPPSSSSPKAKLTPSWEWAVGIVDAGKYAARYKAARVMVGIMHSDLKHRICRCRYKICDRPYFLLDSNCRKAVFRNGGTYCSTVHARRGASAIHEKARTSRFNDQIAEWAAAEVVARWSWSVPWYEDPFKRQLVEVINPRIARDPNRTRETIKANWITHHRALIEAKIAELLQGQKP